MTAYLTKNEARTYRAMQTVLIAVGMYAAFNVVNAKAETVRVIVQPPTVAGIERPPVADYRLAPIVTSRPRALVRHLPEPAPADRCGGAFEDVGAGRCFGRVIMR